MLWRVSWRWWRLNTRKPWRWGRKPSLTSRLSVRSVSFLMTFSYITLCRKSLRLLALCLIILTGRGRRNLHAHCFRKAAGKLGGGIRIPSKSTQGGDYIYSLLIYKKYNLLKCRLLWYLYRIFRKSTTLWDRCTQPTPQPKTHSLFPTCQTRSSKSNFSMITWPPRI